MNKMMNMLMSMISGVASVLGHSAVEAAETQDHNADVRPVAASHEMPVAPNAQPVAGAVPPAQEAVCQVAETPARKPNLADHRGAFKRGESYCATVTAVHEQGVNVQTPYGKGGAQISTKCWGDGVARAEALAALKPGDTLDVVVKAYDTRSRTISLVLANRTDLLGPAPVASYRKQAKSHRVAQKPTPAHTVPNTARKPDYKPLAKGTTLFVDTANLIGSIGPEHAAARLMSLRQALASAGYPVVFYWECRAFTWTKAQQATEAEKRALKAFVAREDVSLVVREADLDIIQAVQATPNSVCLTRDHYNDYAETYPEIVGSPRHRSFSSAKIDGVVVLTVFGLKEAIKLQDTLPDGPKPVASTAVAKPQVTKTVPTAASVVVPEMDDAMAWGELPERAFGPDRRAGLYGCVDGRLAAGDGDTALKLLAKIARTDPAAYEEMSRIYNEGDGLPADARQAKRYARLAKKEQKVARQLARRQKRQVANCVTSLDYADVHGVEKLFLQRDLEHCALKKADYRRARFCTRKSHKRSSSLAA